MKNEAVAVAHEPVKPEEKYPAFVEIEKMLDRVAEFTKETSMKAYDYFLERRNEWSGHFDDWLKAEMQVLRPTPLEIKEHEDTISVRAAVPGFKPEEIEISLKGNLMIISGETKFEETKEDEKVILNEWRSNRFCRQILLPSEVETEDVHPKLKDGILQFTLKKCAATEPANIAVEAA